MIIECEKCKSQKIEIFESNETLKQEETVSPKKWLERKYGSGAFNIVIGEYTPQPARIFVCKDCGSSLYDNGRKLRIEFNLNLGALK